MAEDGDDDSGLSKGVWIVIGVVAVIGVLFVGLILAAVVGSFVLGLGEAPAESELPPTVSFDASVDDEATLSVDALGEDAVDADRIAIEVNGERAGTWADLGGDDAVREGASVTVPGAAAGDTLTVVWIGDDRSSTLYETEL